MKFIQLDFINIECLSETSFPNIDFGDCYKKVQNFLGINKNLVIVIIDKKITNENRPKINSYSKINPETGELLNVEDLCKNDLIKIKENISSLLINLDEDITPILYLLIKNVDIFDLSSPFYTDICYNFDSPFDIDNSLKDQIMMLFSNITLCEPGCEYKGVNINTMEAIYECKFQNLFNHDFLGGEVLIENQFNEITNIISETNIIYN